MVNRQFDQLPQSKQDSVTLTQAIPQFHEFSRKYNLGANWLTTRELDAVTRQAFNSSRNDAQFNQQMQRGLIDALGSRDPVAALRISVQQQRTHGVNINETQQRNLESVADRHENSDESRRAAFTTASRELNALAARQMEARRETAQAHAPAGQTPTETETPATQAAHARASAEARLGGIVRQAGIGDAYRSRLEAAAPILRARGYQPIA